MTVEQTIEYPGFICMERVQPDAPVDLTNTELAFKYKSDKDLLRTYKLFRMMDSPFLTKVGPKMINFGFNVGLPLTSFVKKTLFDIFAGGTSLANTAAKSNFLFENGVYTILDYSVEGEKTEEGFDETRDELLRSLKHAAAHKEVAFTAMKVTGIADFDLLAKYQSAANLSMSEHRSLKMGKQRLRQLCETAHKLKQPLFIDAEETWIQDTIDHWAEEMMATYNKELPIIYTTVQFYRANRIPYLGHLIKDAKEKNYFLGVKLVRGAYLEKERKRAASMGYPDPMQPTKTATDADFNVSLRLCVENIDRVAICAGTHNDKSSLLLTDYMREFGVPNTHPHILFAQLLGMSDNISFNLAHHGYNVAKYLPYGPVKSVMPYLMRRAEENTAIGGQASREVEMLDSEVKRRGI